MTVDQRVLELLERKREIDALQTGLGFSGGQDQFIKRQRWLVDAVELLLQFEVERK